MIKVMKGYNPPECTYAGEVVCKERLSNIVRKSKYWYTPIPEGEGDTTLR